MERIADKGVVVAACLALALVLGEVTAASVVALLLGVVVSSGFDLVRPHAPRVAAGLLVSAGVAACLLPEGAFMLPLLSYDLVRADLPRALSALLAASILVAASSVLGRAPTALLAVVTTGSALLSLRTARVLSAERRLCALEDDLSDKLLSLREKNQELEDARAIEAHAATLSERTRIAREIHDGVGHLLTRLVLQVEALKVVHTGDDGVVGELDELSSGLGEALDSMRRSVHALEDEGVDLSVEMHRLATGCTEAEVRVFHMVESAVPAEVARCMVAVMREALTNAVRHARAKVISVYLTEYPGLWQLRVVNDGRMPTSGTELDGRGMGLRSMRERVAALGGTVRFGVDGGFTVFASIPRGGE